jgi:hypothetical protein
MKDILYNIIPKCWQSYLQHDKFDINQCSIKHLFEIMARYQLANTLDPLLKPQNQSKTDKDESNNKSTEKLNDKKSKAKPKKNDSGMLAPKKSCMLHRSNSSHTTDKC